MCSGGDGGAAARQKQANAKARKRQAELDRLAADRTALAAQQQAEMERLVSSQKDAMAQQQQTAVELSAQGEAQQQQIAAQRLATQSVNQSLQVLATQGKQTEAPTAPLTRGKTKQRTRATSATNDLRIGSSGRSAGVGVNLGG